MNAQLKPNEQAAFDVKLALRRSDVFEIERSNARDGLQDEIQETVYLFLDQILDAYQKGDDCQIGQVIGNSIANYAMHIERSRQAQQLRDELMPSWEDAMADASGKPKSGPL